MKRKAASNIILAAALSSGAAAALAKEPVWCLVSGANDINSAANDPPYDLDPLPVETLEQYLGYHTQSIEYFKDPYADLTGKRTPEWVGAYGCGGAGPQVIHPYIGTTYTNAWGPYAPAGQYLNTTGLHTTSYIPDLDTAYAMVNANALAGAIFPGMKKITHAKFIDAPFWESFWGVDPSDPLQRGAYGSFDTLQAVMSGTLKVSYKGNSVPYVVSSASSWAAQFANVPWATVTEVGPKSPMPVYAKGMGPVSLSTSFRFVFTGGTYSYVNKGVPVTYSAPALDVTVPSNVTIMPMCVYQNEGGFDIAWIKPYGSTLATACPDTLAKVCPRPNHDCDESPVVSGSASDNNSHPVFNALTGIARDSVGTGVSVGGEPLRLNYSNEGQNDTLDSGSIYSSTDRPRKDAPSFGSKSNWKSSYHKQLVINPSSGDYYLTRVDGSKIYFVPQNGGYIPALQPSNDTLTKSGNLYYYTNGINGTIETYTIDGYIQSSRRLDGQVLNYTYSSGPSGDAPDSGYLTQVTDGVGRSVSYQYSLPAGENSKNGGVISKIIDPAGKPISFGYTSYSLPNHTITAQNMTSITWQDGKTRTFKYENGSNPEYLTGTVDENGARINTITYGNPGAGIASSVATTGGGTGTVLQSGAPSVQVAGSVTADGVNAVASATLVAPAQVIVTAPNGQQTTLNPDAIRGVVGDISQPGGSGCTASTQHSQYDIVGNRIGIDDFNGNRSCFSYDAMNRLKRTVVGLPTTFDCTTIDSPGLVLPAGAAYVLNNWHPSRSPLQLSAESSSSVVTLVYNGEADPFNGNAVANCSPIGPMPDGKSTPLLCKDVTQSKTAGGAIDPTLTKISTYTYDGLGNILTSTAPDGKVTAYGYYYDTSFNEGSGHTVGDLKSITNPIGQMVTYDAYDPSGNLLQTTDVRGVISSFTYNPRGLLLTASTQAPGFTARQVTYTYDPTGHVTSIKKPDNTLLTITYDAAYRVATTKDAFGNVVTNGYDNANNPISEVLKDSVGVTKRVVSRSYDALNRVQQSTVSAQ